jgi:hypothetical protein
VSDFEVWDIDQVTVSNFDWLSFIPVWSPSPILHNYPLFLTWYQMLGFNSVTTLIPGCAFLERINVPATLIPNKINQNTL